MSSIFNIGHLTAYLEDDDLASNLIQGGVDAVGTLLTAIQSQSNDFDNVPESLP